MGFLTKVETKVSIIIPIYNSEKYLERCLQSCTGQSLKEIEIICVNDGSTDGSVMIIEKFMRQDKRIKLINKQNCGYGHSMNVGIDHANGEYIGIVETDDLIAEDMYKILYSQVEKNKYDVVRANHYMVTNLLGSLHYREIKQFYGNDYFNKVTNTHENKSLFIGSQINPPGIYRQDFLKENRIRFNETPGASYQDNGFFFQVFILAKKMLFIQDYLYFVRRDNPESSVYNKGKVYAATVEYDYIKKILLRSNDLYEEYKYAYSLRKFLSYIFTYGRIAEEFREEYSHHMSEVFQKARINGELKKEGYFLEQQWNKLNIIIESPDLYRQKYKNG